MPKLIFPDRDFIFHYSAFRWGHPAELTQQVLVFKGGMQLAVAEVVCRDCRLNDGRPFRLLTAESVVRHARQHGRGYREAVRWPVLRPETLYHIDLPQERMGSRTAKEEAS
jgi:hypothetical protein